MDIVKKRAYQYAELILEVLKDDPEQLDVWEAKLKKVVDDNRTDFDCYPQLEYLIVILERLYLARFKVYEYNKLECFTQKWAKEYHEIW